MSGILGQGGLNALLKDIRNMWDIWRKIKNRKCMDNVYRVCLRTQAGVSDLVYGA